jgi:competence protein ComEC
MLLPLTGAFVTGLVLGSFTPYLPITIVLLLLLIVIPLTVFEITGRLTRARSLALYGGLLAGVLYWSLFAWISAGSPVARAAGSGPVRIVGRVVEPVRHFPSRLVMVLALSSLGEEATLRPAEGRVRVTWREPDRDLRQGDLVTLFGRVREPSGTLNAGGFDYAAWLTRRGINGMVSASGPGAVGVFEADSVPFRWWPWWIIDGWREHIRRAAEATLTGPALGIFLGIIIGEPGYLEPAVRDAFMATGTVHILSISGSHLGLIAFLSFFLVKGGCRRLPTVWLEHLSRRTTPTRLAAIMTVAPVIFYTLLAGAEVATVRSLVMILVFLMAVWLGRDRHLLLALAGAALLIVGHDPRVLFDISFQLSYMSVLAIALVLRWTGRPDQVGELERKFARWRPGEWLREYVWITGAVTLMTVPLVAYHFNQIPWLGLAANLFVVPFAGGVLVPLGLGAAVWLLLGGGSVLPGGPLIQALVDSMTAFVEWLARVPGAEWHVASPAVAGMVMFYLLLFMAVRPASGRGIRWTGAIGVTLLLIWWSWSPRTIQDGETLRVTFLDVGQGDASLLELPDGVTVLVDGGAAYDTLDMGRAVVAPYLWDRGIRRLDHVIGTHPQLDHVGGLPWILRSFEVGHYWGNGIQRDEVFYHRLKEALRARGLVEEVAREGQILVESNLCRVSVLNPPAGSPTGLSPGVTASGGGHLNNLSVVTRLDCGPQSFLFTADVETGALTRLMAGRADSRARVLKVPHHGARSSLDLSWIERVHPDTAIISVGAHNPYGHPAQAVLAAYAAGGVRVLRTDRLGGIWITARASSPAIEVHATREELPEPVSVGRSMLSAERLNLGRLWRGWLGG